ncbi:MAG: U32 family peptidase [Clostridia bacterium]|nr:U32 family peptidase [Clostridia bacterium]
MHLSTQAGVCNEYGAKLAKEFGFSRVILSRETNLGDINKIAEIIETEVFIQGALCTCFSGQCYMSSFIGRNSGNRGMCKQPCRKLYSIDRDGFTDLAYRLSLSDLCVGEKIQDLIKAGVTSFKIEGRMRRPEYVAAAVQFYRDILDGKEGDLSSLKRTYNLGNYTNGLAFGQDENFISSAVQGHLGEFIGVICVKNGNYVCHSTSQFVKGDGFKVLRGGKEVGGAAFAESIKGGFIVSGDIKLKNGDKLFITTDVELNKRLLSKKRYKDVEISASFVEGEAPRVTFGGFIFNGDTPLAKAESRALTKDDIISCFKKVDGRPFNVSFKNIEISGNPYLGMSSLNALRRDIYRKYDGILFNKGGRNIEIPLVFPEKSTNTNSKKAVISSDLNGISADIGIYKPFEYFKDHTAFVDKFEGEKFIYLPPYMSGEELEKLKPYLSPFDGVYCEGTYGLLYAREVNKKLFAGVGFNITNSVSASYCSADYICISKELTVKEAARFGGENTFYLSGGGIKLMDIIYCPFSKTCSTCDRRQFYTLTDGEGRKFPLRRYSTSSCRFELYNCALLKCVEGDGVGNLYDYSNGIIQSENITKGHTQLSVK